MAGSDKRKQSLYFPEDMLKEIQDEATRQDRSLSWIVQKAWKIARKEIMKYPSVNEFPGEEDEKEIAAIGRTVGIDEINCPRTAHEFVFGLVFDLNEPGHKLALARPVGALRSRDPRVPIYDVSEARK